MIMFIDYVTTIGRSLVSRFFIILVCIAFAPLWLLIIFVPLKIKLKIPGIFTLVDYFYKAILACTFLPILIVETNDNTGEPAIIVANHSSALDILLVGVAMNKTPHVWFATTYLLQFPLLRYIIPRVALMVNTDSLLTAMRSLIAAQSFIKDNQANFIIFPEGGRYTDGFVHKFFGGFAALARKSNRPVRPVHIFNAEKAYPPNTFLIRQYPITMIIGPTMRIMENESDAQFVMRVYDWFVQKAVNEKS